MSTYSISEIKSILSPVFTYDISLNKMTCFVFGNDSRSNFTGGNKTCLTLLQTVTDAEYELQKIKFVAENRKEMNLSKDVWMLYQKHGDRINYVQKLCIN